jgi:hypothetical protein
MGRGDGLLSRLPTLGLGALPSSLLLIGFSLSLDRGPLVHSPFSTHCQQKQICCVVLRFWNYSEAQPAGVRQVAPGRSTVKAVAITGRSTSATRRNRPHKARLLVWRHTAFFFPPAVAAPASLRVPFVRVVLVLCDSATVPAYDRLVVKKVQMGLYN